jgi:transposase InsO family protein
MKVDHHLAAVCRALGIARSGFYARQARGASAAERRAAKLDVEVAAAFKRRKGRYGSPRVTNDLHLHGRIVSRRRVAASLRRQHLVARPKRRFVTTTDSSHGRPSPPNLVQRKFETDAPNKVWVADTTYLPTRTGFVYLVVVLDLFARRVVGWSVGDSLDSKLAARALRRAMRSRRPKPGLIAHTDRGGEFLSTAWRAVLRAHAALASASATGCCYDNAVAESFFSTLEFEGPSTRLWRDCEDAERSLPSFIEAWYNNERFHSFNGQRSPAETETRWQLAT